MWNKLFANPKDPHRIKSIPGKICKACGEREDRFDESDKEGQCRTCAYMYMVHAQIEGLSKAEALRVLSLVMRDVRNW